MRLYTLGPAEMFDYTMEIGGSQVPYFRNQEFSEVVFSCMSGMKKLVNCEEEGEAVFLTCSGTGGMEAVILNTFDENDHLLVIDGGSFGHRFVQLCELHHIPHTAVVVPRGVTLTREMVEEAAGDKRVTALLVNIHESSTGQLYDKKMLSDFCKEKGCYFIVDAISSFLADELDMQKDGIDEVILSSQKALALAPGLSIVLLGSKILKERIMPMPAKTMYLDFKEHIKNGKRGQTPFTPAVRVIIELQKRVEMILQNGVEEEIRRTGEIASDFRKKIREIGLSYPDYPLSNAGTPVIFPNNNAYDVYSVLAHEYGLIVNPSGGDLANKIFRVGHFGNQTVETNKYLLDAMKEIMEGEMEK